MEIYKFDPDDARQFAREQGIKTRVRGDELQFEICPYCRPQKDKWTFAINIKSELGVYNCRRASCNAKGNMILISQNFNFSLGRDADEYYSRRRKYRNLSNYPRPEVRDAAVAYLESRGISKKTAKTFSITTRKDNDKIIVFPFFDDDKEMQFVKYRNIEFNKEEHNGSKEWCESNCRPILFGMDRCEPDVNGTLILTEGQIDSLSVYECGFINAVSVPTGANGFTWVPYCWDFMQKFETLIVFGDYERGHMSLLDEMKSRFNGAVKHVRPEDYLDCKDANELLLKHGKSAVVNAVNNAIPIKNNHIKKMSEVKMVDMSQMQFIKSGIAQLDKMIGGFYFGQLIVISGERGLGKSTLASQFCIQAIADNKPVFIYSGELTDGYVQSWLDRQIAGAQYIDTETKDGFINYSVRMFAAQNIHRWYDDLCYLYGNNALDQDADEDEALLETLRTAIRQYGCQVLLIDNLMTAIEDDISSDLYRQQATFVKQLAMLAKETKTIIFLIAHPRKVPGNGTKRNDDIAGSGNITNYADVVLWYEADSGNDKGDTRLLRVSKNRLNGKISRNDGIRLWFEESSKRISEDSTSFLYRWEKGKDRIDLINDFVQVDDFETGDIPF